MKVFFSTLLELILCTTLHAQNKSNIQFGKIDPSDFNINSPLVNSNTNAVTIADIGSSQFEGNNKGWFTLVYKRIRRIKIVDIKGADVANVSIRLYTDNGYYQDNKNKELLVDLKGATYNNDDGNISATKLDATSVFETRLSKNWIEKKFTLPAVKAGSIIEYTYTIKSDFIFNLQPWNFQGKYPCLWSEYKVRIPDCFAYIFLTSGYNPFYINEKKTDNEVFRIEDPSPKNSGLASSYEVSILNAFIAVNRWVMKDVPALKDESMLFSTKNYASKIEFQLAQYRFSEIPENKINNWKNASTDLLESHDFGWQLRENDWLLNEDDKITGSSTNKLEKAKKIFAFVRDNFTCVDTEGVLLTRDVLLRTIFISRKGSVSDINILLTAMMQKDGIKADPVILSTRDNGTVHPVYPILNKYNYVIARIMINDTAYYLDAGSRYMGFNKLPLKCYNGLARAISIDTAAINLSAESLNEVSGKILFLSNNDDGKSMSGTFSETPGYYQSSALRETLSAESVDDYFKIVQKEYPSEIKINNGTIDSLKQYDYPLNIKYNILFDYSNDDVLYFNPVLAHALKENPFKSVSERLYPIELPYCSEDIFLLNMQVPKGYAVEEMPKSARIKMENNAGIFEYLIANDDNNIQLKCRLKINKAIFEADDYTSLRNFYAAVIKKQSEQIVFKRAK